MEENKLSRQGNRVKVKEMAYWKTKVEPELESINSDFLTALFDEEDSRSYGVIFQEFNIKWQSRIRFWNHRFNLIKGSEYAFFKSFFPIENFKSAA